MATGMSDQSFQVRGAVSAYHNTLEKLFLQRLAEELDIQVNAICAGVMDHDRYKYEAGRLEGLKVAKRIMEKTIDDIMKG